MHNTFSTIIYNENMGMQMFLLLGNFDKFSELRDFNIILYTK